MCKAGEHFMICPNYVEPDEFAWMYRGVTGEKNTSRKRKNNKVQYHLPDRQQVNSTLEEIIQSVLR